MGNRFTQTTLTARELDTIERCARKIGDIWLRRDKLPNEKQKPLKNLFKAVMLLDGLSFDVKQARNEINEEAKL